MVNLRGKGRFPSPRVFRPSRNAACLCGSGKKFKKCCADTYGRKQLVTAAGSLLNERKYEEALIQCRADITQYTIWHKSHTEPAVRAGFAAIQPLLDIDIKALSELVSLLFKCYVRSEKAEEFPATLERLRQNIGDEWWQRKITYFHALYALWPGRDEAAARRELIKLGSLEHERDVEILQLYVTLFGSQFSFSKMEQLVNRILDLCESPTDRLHYRSLKGIQYLMIGDNDRVREELASAISEFRRSRDEPTTGYQAYRLALSLGLLGVIRHDAALLEEALGLYQQILVSDGWTQEGQAEIRRLIGDTYRHMEDWDKARASYVGALEYDPAAIHRVFLSECLLHLAKHREAISLINEINATELDQNQYLDYVFILATISVETGSKELLAKAETLLRQAKPSAPYFRKERDAMLLSVVETQRNGPSNSVVQRAKQILGGLARTARRYLILEPNIMGIGVDIGKLVDDLAKGTEAHSSGASKQRVELDTHETQTRHE